MLEYELYRLCGLLSLIFYIIIYTIKAGLFIVAVSLLWESLEILVEYIKKTYLGEKKDE